MVNKLIGNEQTQVTLSLNLRQMGDINQTVNKVVNE
jgi:hypothetical protein